MNIGQILRALVGEAKPADSKVLELKVGQVVKGLVMQLLSEHEAMMNIGGVQVRAKIESPLRQGQVTLLQVQPESSGGQIILKPLQASTTPIAESSLADLLKEFGLKDQSSNRQLLQTLHKNGIEPNKDNVAAFLRVISEVGPSEDVQEWLQASTVAHHRGLPVTQQTVSAIRHVLFGDSLSGELAALNDTLSASLQGGPEAAGSPPWPALTKSLAERLQTAIRNLAVLSEEMTLATGTTGITGAPPAAGGISGRFGDAVVPQAEVHLPVRQSGSSVVLGNASQSPAVNAPSPSTPVTAGSQGQAARGNVSDLAAESVQGIGSSEHLAVLETGGRQRSDAQAGMWTNNGESAISRSSRQGAQAAVREQAVMKEPVETAADSSAASRGASLHADKGDLLNRMLKLIGLEHENQLHRGQRAVQSFAPVPSDSDGSSLASRNFILDARPEGNTESSPPHVSLDSIKSLLLQLSQSDEVPAALKEQLQPVLQQITGQQLLAMSDRAAMFSHVTLFVPFMGEGGNQAAVVHVQSRRNQRGEVDAGNCRLLFDLRMKHLGDMLVDVHVIDRIVSLQVHNDHPVIQQLIDQHRSEISEALNQAGYQFASIRVLPPFRFDVEKSSVKEDGGQAPAHAADTAYLFKSKTYKGMDVRI